MNHGHVSFNLLPRLLAAALAVVAFPVTPVSVNAEPVVLMYHRFETHKSAPTVVTPNEFSEQMAYLHEHGIPVISASELVHKLEVHEALPKRAVVITLDDGWRSGMVAKDVLNEYNFPYLTALYTEVLEERVPSYLSATNVQALANDNRCTIANHSYSHSAGVMAGHRGSQQADIARAQAYLARITGRQPEFFVYPYGIVNAKLRNTVMAAGFRAAFGTEEAPVRPSADLWTLPRYNVTSTPTFLVALAAMDAQPRAPRSGLPGHERTLRLKHRGPPAAREGL